MRTLPFALILGLLVLSSSAILFSNKDVKGVGAPAITIELASNKGTADVEPDEDYDGIVQFSGTVTVIVPWSPSIQTLTVYLNATAGNGTGHWPATTSPPMTFSSQVTTQNFQVVVRVPQETTQYPQGLLTVSGRWRYSPGTMGGSIEPATALIEIIGYYDHSITSVDSYQEMYRSEEAEFGLLLSNEGNAYDTYSFSVENRNGLNNEGVFVNVVEIEVPPLSEVMVRVMVTTSSTATRGNHEIEVRTTARNASMAGDPDVSRSVVLDLRVLSGERPSEEPDTVPDTVPDEPDVPNGDDTAPVDGDDDEVGDDDDDGGGIPVAGLIVAGILMMMVVLVGILAYIFGRRQD